ncbi:MAG: glycosyltransferase family 9 protein [bacterium]
MLENNLIGIIRLDRLGDTVLTLPAVKILKENYSDFKIVAILSNYNSNLFVYKNKIIHPFFDVIEIIDIKLNYYLNDIYSIFIKTYDNFLNFINIFKFTKILNKKYKFKKLYIFSPNFVSYLLGYFLKANEKYTYFYKTKLFDYYLFKSKYSFYLDNIDKVFEQEYISKGVKINHEVIQNLLVLKQDSDIKLQIDFEDFSHEDLKKFRPYLVSPNLDIEVFDVLFFDKNLLIKDNVSKEFLKKLILELNSYLKNKKIKFAFITNREWMLQDIKILKPNIMELLYLISNSKLVISFDGGPVHIASAFNIPIIALFSNRYFYFDSYRWAPLSDKSFIIKLDIFDEQFNSYDFSHLEHFNIFYQIKYFIDKII